MSHVAASKHVPLLEANPLAGLSKTEITTALAAELSSTLFAMGRFCNIFLASGSVLSLFRRQIAARGSRHTHPEIIRYFMTNPEAASLVLQACVLAEGGDLFLLDLGEPVRM